MAQADIGHLKIVVTNMKAVRALRFAARVLQDVGEDMPWRPDCKKAAKAMRYAIEYLDAVPTSGDQ